ncbi:MAG: protein kinase [Polyangiaceae bacterium]|nr:protein kinase [Polyangiaceae bacterium]
MSYTQRQYQDGETIAGTRFRVLGLLGVGGMGAVYDVEHTELGKRFVLKTLHQSLSTSDELVARLRNEWRALGRLAHPNIVNVTDAGTTADGSAYYVMERLEGEPLSSRMSRVGRHTLLEAIAIAEGILHALGAAHEIGVIHRDVKPPNVFVLTDGTVKLLDFGIAKVAESEVGPITMRGIAIGTPRYMAPEQARGDTVDSRADLYATGLILFELVAGASPFEGSRDANELLIAQLTKEPPSLRSLVPTVPVEFDELVHSLLAKEAKKRPATAQEVLRRLEAIAAKNDPRISGAPPQVAVHGVHALTPSARQRIAESATVFQEVVSDASRSQRLVPTLPLPAGENFRSPNSASPRDSAPPTHTRSPQDLGATLGTLASPAMGSPLPQSTPPPLSSTMSHPAPGTGARKWLLGALIGSGSAAVAFTLVMASGVLSNPAPEPLAPLAAAPSPTVTSPPPAAAPKEVLPESPAKTLPVAPAAAATVEAVQAAPAASAPSAPAPARPKAAKNAPSGPPKPAAKPEAPVSEPPKSVRVEPRATSESISNERSAPARSKLPVSGL